jgi:hypothetical protein
VERDGRVGHPWDTPQFWDTLNGTPFLQTASRDTPGFTPVGHPPCTHLRVHFPILPSIFLDPRFPGTPLALAPLITPLVRSRLDTWITISANGIPPHYLQLHNNPRYREVRICLATWPGTPLSYFDTLREGPSVSNGSSACHGLRETLGRPRTILRRSANFLSGAYAFASSELGRGDRGGRGQATGFREGPRLATNPKTSNMSPNAKMTAN